MAELLGDFPRSIYQGGRYSKKYFTRQGALRNIRHLEFWPLRNVLVEKYKYPEADAAEIASFLLPMLVMDPTKRATAEECLLHPWLQRTSDGSRQPPRPKVGESIVPGTVDGIHHEVRSSSI